MRVHLRNSIDARLLALAFKAGVSEFDATGDDADLHVVVEELAANWRSIPDAVKATVVGIARVRRDDPFTSAFGCLIDLSREESGRGVIR